MVERFLVRRPDGPLAQLHRLEWRYDGPLPAEVLSTLEATPAEAARRRAMADSALLDGLARETVRSLAAARRRATATPCRNLAAHGALPRLARDRQAGLARRDEDFQAR